ncbi:hypothetical protein ACQEU3_40765 [Spirillospora sp. CA-253888]
MGVLYASMPILYWFAAVPASMTAVAAVMAGCRLRRRAGRSGRVRLCDGACVLPSGLIGMVVAAGVLVIAVIALQRLVEDVTLR